MIFWILRLENRFAGSTVVEFPFDSPEPGRLIWKPVDQTVLLQTSKRRIGKLYHDIPFTPLTKRNTFCQQVGFVIENL
jgi:hypothetical protein